MNEDPAIQFLKKGFNLFMKNNFKEALDYYDKALEKKPDDIVILFDKAEILRKLERVEEAVSILDKILEIDPYVYPKYGERSSEIGSRVPNWDGAHLPLGKPFDREDVLDKKYFALWDLKKWDEMEKCKKQKEEWRNRKKAKF